MIVTSVPILALVEYMGVAVGAVGGEFNWKPCLVCVALGVFLCEKLMK